MSVAGGAPLLVPKPEVEPMDEDFMATQSAAPFLNQSLAPDTQRKAQPASHTVTMPGDGSHVSAKRESGQPQNIDQSTAPFGAEPKCHWLTGQAANGDAEELGAMPAAEPLPVLHPEQRQVLDDVLNGENVMVSGVGGTGKSFLLKCIIKCLIRYAGFVDTEDNGLEPVWEAKDQAVFGYELTALDSAFLAAYNPFTFIYCPFFASSSSH
jgi:hypothetical protein